MNRVGVIGLGTMGAGIARVCASAGVQTIGWELTDDLAAHGRGVIEGGLAREVAKERLTEPVKEEILARLETTTELGALEGCELVIEAVVEDIDVKRDLFARLETVIAEDTVLATNTSALSVTEIAAAVKYPGRVVGMHFFNPVPVLPLVEIVRAELTTDESVEAARAFAQQIGKQPIVCLDTPGFVVNRVLVPALNEAVRALDQGLASAEEIDLGMRTGTNWPIGPLALLDLVGIDTYVRVCDALWDAYHETQFAAPPRIRRMATAGLLGRKSGRGFYDYEEKAR